MRKSWSRFALCAIAVLAACGLLPNGAAAAGEETEVAFAERYREVLHGGITSTANSVITCGEAVTADATPCAETQRGSDGRGGEYDMTYIDVDSDPNTYNSSRAELTLPPGAEVAHARLYWGANIRVGEQKPPEDNGRVLIAEPNGAYKELLADSVIGHHDAGAYESFSASADVTALVRQAGAGSYTVGQINVARGHSDTGGWGGWALVVAYEDEDEPLREVALLDGFQALDEPGEGLDLAVPELRTAADAGGSLGVVAFGGDRGQTGDSVSVSGAGGAARQLTDSANPATDVMNSTIGHLGTPTAAREPAHANTLGFDADVFDVSPALAGGADRLGMHFASGGDSYQIGAVFLQADAAAQATSPANPRPAVRPGPR
ncbi:DUF3344 domain-containing protein [Streptomyces sp. B6B3]|uniref:DUF3344 domain-containing protein n=1 Tax=Streptomyces sp. B6B3 TaxID=3153570 RepID=UPI00325DDA00